MSFSQVFNTKPVISKPIVTEYMDASNKRYWNHKANSWLVAMGDLYVILKMQFLILFH